MQGLVRYQTDLPMEQEHCRINLQPLVALQMQVQLLRPQKVKELEQHCQIIPPWQEPEHQIHY